MPEVLGSDRALQFMIIVGGAIDWREQAKFNLERRLATDFSPSTEVDRERNCAELLNSALRAGVNYQTYIEWYRQSFDFCQDEPLSFDRWHFISLNWQNNATVALKKS